MSETMVSDLTNFIGLLDEHEEDMVSIDVVVGELREIIMNELMATGILAEVSE